MTELNYVVRGKANAPAVLFVHALGTDHRFWDETIELLADDYFCIAPDLRAAGQSPRPPHPVTAAEHAADLTDLLRELEVKRAVMIGSAIGGMIAATLAGIEVGMAAGLAMTNPGARITEVQQERLRASAEEVRRHGMAALLPAAADRVFNGMKKDARYDLYVERYRAQDAEKYALSALGFVDLDIRPLLPQVKCPVLLIPGGLDNLMAADSADVIASLAPQAQIVRFEEVAHFIPLQAPERFAATLRPFLANKARW
jgi:3-oxoadipate enol-lactonase